MKKIVKKGAEKKTGKKLTEAEFAKKAILKLRKDGYKGIHTVFSGYNAAFKDYFDGADPIKATNRLVEEGEIAMRFVKKGVMIYLPDDAPEQGDSGKAALKKIFDED